MLKLAAHRLVDAYFAKYAESHQNPTNKRIHWICVPLLLFGLLGLVWAIPFPRLEVLGRYGGYVNWATFLILFSIIYYLRLSRKLALAMLLVICIFAAGIVTLEKLHNNGGWPPMWHVCLLIFMVAWAGQFFGHKIEGRRLPFPDNVKFLLIGPIWLCHFLFNKAGIRY